MTDQIGQPLWFSLIQRHLPDADPRDPVDLAVYRLWMDVTGRKGWDAYWDEFDSEIKGEVLAAWREILRNAFNPPQVKLVQGETLHVGQNLVRVEYDGEVITIRKVSGPTAESTLTELDAEGTSTFGVIRLAVCRLRENF